MIVKSFNGVLAAACVLVLTLTGCAREILTVPPRASVVEAIHVNQTYALQHKTEMDALTSPDAQPVVNLLYWKAELPPAEAFERVPFPMEAPGADSISWSSVTLDAGTLISVSVAEVYQNSHVYVGRVTTGDFRNSHILLVVPIGDAHSPTLEQLQAEDKGYITPTSVLDTRPTTALGDGP